MTAILLEMLESLSLQWPIALTFMSFPIGLSIWLIRHRSGRWSSNSLILSGLAVMIVGLSRPMMQGIEPTPLDQVILVIDSSASMRASDVLPSRIDLAKQIANAFIEALPAHASLGLISMAANASVIQTPTRQRHQLEQALERISLQPGSALGSAIILATAQAIPEAAIDVERLITGSSRRSMVSSSSLSNASEAGSGSNEAFKQPESPASPGSRESSVIVLLADGDSNMGPAPLEMAEVARLWGLRIYSIGIGTRDGAVLRSDGVTARVRLEDKTLKALTSSTAAEYFALEDKAAVKQIFASLSGRIGLKRKKKIEVTHWFALVGSMLLIAGALMNVQRHGRIL
jgi:Ca-activated chloride channel family protein